MKDFCLVHGTANSFKVGDKVRLKYHPNDGIFTVIKIELTDAKYPVGGEPVGNFIYLNDGSGIGWWPRNVYHI